MWHRNDIFQWWKVEKMKSEAFKIHYAHLCVVMRFYACFRVSQLDDMFWKNKTFSLEFQTLVGNTARIKLNFEVIVISKGQPIKNYLYQLVQGTLCTVNEVTEKNYHTVQKIMVISNKCPRTFDSFFSLYVIYAYMKTLK